MVSLPFDFECSKIWLHLFRDNDQIENIPPRYFRFNIYPKGWYYRTPKGGEGEEKAMRTPEEIAARIELLESKVLNKPPAARGGLYREIYTLKWVLNLPKEKTASKIVKNALAKHSESVT